jgi:hypothetical protein
VTPFISKHKRAIVIAVVALVLLFAALMIFAIYAARSLFDSDRATPTASQYSAWVSLWLPQDVQNFQAYGEGWQDWLLEARFEITASQVPEFLERNKLQRIDAETLPESSYGLEWFRAAGRLEHYQIGPLPNSAGSTPTGFYPRIRVDPSKPDNFTIYIKARDT